MEILSNDKVTVHIDQTGMISHWSYQGLPFIKCAYLVFFKDYSRTDPFCRPWDMSSKIDDMITARDSLRYTKEIECLSSICTISLRDSGWDWRFKITSKYPMNCRMGIATPCLPGKLRGIDRSIDTAIVQYYRSFQEVFPDQSYIDVPLIVTGSGDSLLMTCVPMNHDYQFFHYLDENESYIRLTTSTTLADEIIVSVLICDSLDGAKKTYIGMHPESDTYINKWKPMISTIARQQGIEISYEHIDSIMEFGADEIKIKPAEEKYLERYVEMLYKELSKYPHGFLKSVGVGGFMLCGPIQSGSRALGGICIGQKAMSWIFYDTTQIHESIIHHEIFHFIDSNLSISNWPEGSTIFSAANSDIREQQADVFALLMTDSVADDPRIEVMRIALSIFDNRLVPKKSIKPIAGLLWAIKGRNRTQISFGDIPEDCVGMDFVTESKIYDNWH